MRNARISLLMLAASLAAHADFSYTMTEKSGNDQSSKHYFKGQKMKLERTNGSTILDFDAQTVTSIDDEAKTYAVRKFSDSANAKMIDVKADVKNTGQKKNMNGYDAEQVIMTMDATLPRGQQTMKLQIEVELWLTRDVPGSQEAAAFNRKNADHFPVAALVGGNNPGMQNAMAKLERQLAETGGLPVVEVIRIKPVGGSGLSDAQAQKMAGMRAQMEAMAKQGGPQAAVAQQALARMGAVGAGSLYETTLESGNFSAAPILDSVFAIPTGYKRSEK